MKYMLIIYGHGYGFVVSCKVDYCMFSLFEYCGEKIFSG